MTIDIIPIILVSIPIMIILGIRHALEVDHIIAIDNLIRLHNMSKKARWIGTSFSAGHMLSVLGEMIFIIYIVRGLTGIDVLSFWGGIIGAIGIGIIGFVNIYTMKKWGKTGSAILATKILARTGTLGPFGSALATGIVFGLGFDTATQISAITLSAVASTIAGTQLALILIGFFAIGMISIDTLDSFALSSAFSRIFTTKGFKCLSYALSSVAIAVSVLFSYSTITNSNIVPIWTGPSMAAAVIVIAFGYGLVTRKKNSLYEHEKSEHDQEEHHP
jgi:high-affinity nickel-transport protein